MGKYTLEKHTSEKYTFRKYTIGKYTFGLSSTKTTAPQKCSAAQNYDGLTDGPTYGLIWEGARDTCVSKKHLPGVASCGLFCFCHRSPCCIFFLQVYGASWLSHVVIR